MSSKAYQRFTMLILEQIFFSFIFQLQLLNNLKIIIFYATALALHVPLFFHGNLQTHSASK